MQSPESLLIERIMQQYAEQLLAEKHVKSHI
jgi:hypothetical protein